MPKDVRWRRSRSHRNEHNDHGGGCDDTGRTGRLSADRLEWLVDVLGDVRHWYYGAQSADRSGGAQRRCGVPNETGEAAPLLPGTVSIGRTFLNDILYQNIGII